MVHILWNHVKNEQSGSQSKHPKGLPFGHVWLAGQDRLDFVFEGTLKSQGEYVDLMSVRLGLSLASKSKTQSYLPICGLDGKGTDLKGNHNPGMLLIRRHCQEVNEVIGCFEFHCGVSFTFFFPARRVWEGWRTDMRRQVNERWDMGCFVLCLTLAEFILSHSRPSFPNSHYAPRIRVGWRNVTNMGGAGDMMNSSSNYLQEEWLHCSNSRQSGTRKERVGAKHIALWTHRVHHRLSWHRGWTQQFGIQLFCRLGLEPDTMSLWPMPC